MWFFFKWTILLPAKSNFVGSSLFFMINAFEPYFFIDELRISYYKTTQILLLKVFIFGILLFQQLGDIMIHVIFMWCCWDKCQDFTGSWLGLTWIPPRLKLGFATLLIVKHIHFSSCIQGFFYFASSFCGFKLGHFFGFQ